MTVEYGTKEDISSWMKLVSSVSWNFPGLERVENYGRLGYRSKKTLE